MNETPYATTPDQPSGSESPHARKKNKVLLIVLLAAGALLVVLVIAILVFTFVLDSPSLSALLGRTRPGVVALVGNQEVTVAEVQQYFELVRRSTSQGNIPPEVRTVVLQVAVDSLIAKKALVYGAGRKGLRVADQEVADYLQHGPFSGMLYPGGQFIGAERYKELVERQANMTVKQFERDVRDELLIKKLVDPMTAAITVAPEEVRQEYLKQNSIGKEPSAEEFTAQKGQIEQRLLGEKQVKLVQTYTKDLCQRLEKEGKIRKNKQEIDRLGLPAK